MIIRGRFPATHKFQHLDRETLFGEATFDEVSLDIAKFGAQQPLVALDVLLVHAQHRNLSLFHVRPLRFRRCFRVGAVTDYMQESTPR